MRISGKFALKWSSIYLLLLLSLFTPVNVITVNLIMVPALVLFVKLTKTSFAIHYLGVLLITCLIFGYSGVMIALFSLFFLAPVVVMGVLYKKQAAARTAITGGILAMLAVLLLSLLALTTSGVNISQSLETYVQEYLASVPGPLGLELTDDRLDAIIDRFTQLIPLYLICFSFYYVVITHWVGRKILVRNGVDVPGLRPAKEWMLPKSLVWYYLIALFISFFISRDSDSVWNTILANMIPLLMYAFAIQAIAFLSFIADLKQWNRTLPIIGILMFPFFPNILSMLGLFDVAFGIRNRLKNK